ncbi:NACHT domain-containing protein [Lentzea tibetensis]|uniref:NACHT domain-containing protein n=1 Tax=Lentzea tibetensis TaxID=2591470 RepID=A0A563F3J4_9PSEU|nr:NACHT domain-containing protein [Lentzea tibetensis]TWP54341.1 NACHT domain-containing protein [Lentzea tibetensis]
MWAASGIVCSVVLSVFANTLSLPKLVLWCAVAVAALLTVYATARQFQNQASSVGGLDSIADMLAEATERLWYKASRTWRLNPEAPVLVSWTRDGKASLCSPDSSLLSEGLITELHDNLYQVPGRRQLVLVGAAGTGKTTAMLLLLHAALRRRATAPVDDRGDRVPVPVWLTLGSWDPDRATLSEYAARTVATMLGLPGPDRSPTGPAWRLVDERRVALFLDGLDEMPEQRRNAAFRYINKLAREGMRIVVTTRPAKRSVKDGGRFDFPVVVRLNPVAPSTAADFLLRDQTEENHPRWQELADFLRTHPRSAVAEALTTPLTISLARDAYADHDTKPIELAGIARPRDVVERLIGEFLDRAYSNDGGADRKRDDRRECRRAARERVTMTWLARQMGTDRDLIWWQIPTWAPASAVRMRCGGVLAATVLVIMMAGTFTLGTDAPWWVSLLPVGIAYLNSEWWCGRRIGKPPATLVWRRPTLRDLGKMMAFSALGGVLFGSIVAAKHSVWAGLAVVGMFVVMGVLGSGLGESFAGGLLAAATTPLADSPLITPYDAYRADRRRTVITVLSGAAAGGVFIGLLGLFDADVTTGVLWGVSIGLVLGWMGGMGPALLLAITRPAGRRSAKRLMPTLEAALDRQVLRQSGVVYQFRHAALQDHLRKVDVDDVDAA